MSNQPRKTKLSGIPAGHYLLNHLDRFLLIISGILIFTAAYIADFLMLLTAINSWVIGINIYRFTFLILIFALRREVVRWIGLIGFRVVYYLLINHFIDAYLGYDDWSTNDSLTAAGLSVEAVIFYFGDSINPFFIRALLKIKKRFKQYS